METIYCLEAVYNLNKFLSRESSYCFVLGKPNSCCKTAGQLNRQVSAFYLAYQHIFLIVLGN